MLPKNVSIIFIENWHYDIDCAEDFIKELSRDLNNRFLIKLGGDVTEYVKAERHERVPNKYLHNVPALHIVLFEKSSCFPMYIFPYWSFSSELNLKENALESVISAFLSI